jgi:hypothetical protein
MKFFNFRAAAPDKPAPAAAPTDPPPADAQPMDGTEPDPADVEMIARLTSIEGKLDALIAAMDSGASTAPADAAPPAESTLAVPPVAADRSNAAGENIHPWTKQFPR